MDIKSLDVSLLYHACDLGGLDFNTTETLDILPEIIGQERVLESLRFGVGISHEGYNLYVMGSTGVGRHRVVTDTLNRLSQPAGKRSLDWCYVANFDDPNQPQTLCLPPGMGRMLRQDMEILVGDLLGAIPAALQSKEFRHRAEEITASLQEQEKKIAADFGERTREQGIALLHSPNGYSLVPLKGDKILSAEAFRELPEEERAEIESKIEAFHRELRDTLGQIPLWQREMRVRYKALEQEVAELVVNRLVSELTRKYVEQAELVSYLDQVRSDVLDNLERFLNNEDEAGNLIEADDPRFTRYRINLLVDNRDGPAVPIIYEPNPTYQNLLGRVEHQARMGTLATDFTLIKSGALHRANDGFLVLDAEKLLSNGFAWDALKRALNAREVRIEPLERQLSMLNTITLEPDPIPIDLKVVLIGDRQIYHLLKAYDSDFGTLFKVVADFSESLPRENGNDERFARLIATLQRQEGLHPVTKAAVQRLIEEAARNAGNGEKLSLHIGSLLDLLKESDYRAEALDSESIGAEHVQWAIQQQLRRVSQYCELLQQEILNGILMIDTDGIQLGRVNGLAVVQVGDHAFGLPNRISATARIGSGEVIDIEREVDQGGPIHSKGVFILAAYLNRRYARYQPLSVAATLVFEQTYGEVEGDSASAGELCALLSVLGDIPIRQSLAITGSVNQHGEMQPIGGVCEKIEGFFDICDKRGLDGTQGVIIPETNVRDLMLKRAVVEAAEAGQFHVYAVKHVEQALELLTGLPAGVADDQGIYSEETLNGKVQARLAEWFALRLSLSGHTVGG